MKISREEKEKRKKRIRERIQIKMEQENYEYVAGEDEPDIQDIWCLRLRVAVYVRVSTDDVRQTTSFELQSKYYENFVTQHPNWTLVDVYADEGISGTTDEHRTGFLRMIEACKAGKIDLIITKSVSRFWRNNEQLLRTIRELTEHDPPIGVFFETEGIYSLKDESEMALSFQGTMAQEESHAKSRGMETSLRMRLDHGLPLTPELLGYQLNDKGKLIINHETEHIPRLMFYMYLYGYSTQEIADALTELGKKSYRGNAKWSSGSVVSTLRNERYCGDVYTRKRYTKSWKTHKTAKNKGKRPISRYYDEHEAIVSRDDYNAVQRMLDNSKYGNKSILPELRVINDGLLKGFVIINPRWGGFKEPEYLQASASVYDEPIHTSPVSDEVKIEVNAGDFDMRGFQIARSEFFDSNRSPWVSFSDKKLKFSVECIRKFSSDIYIELLIHPTMKQFAIRSAKKENRNAVVWAKTIEGVKQPKEISCGAFYNTVLSLFGWKSSYRYRIRGTLFESESEIAYIFDAKNAEAFVQPASLMTGSDSVKPLTFSGSRVRAMPESWLHSFGQDYYLDHSSNNPDKETKEELQLRIEGQLFDTGTKLEVTDIEELRRFIKDQLTKQPIQEAENNGAN